MVKQSQIKDIWLNISTIPSQVLAKNYKKSISPTKKYFSSFLKDLNDLISDLKASKSTRPSSLPTEIMKQLNDTIVPPLAELINKSFQSGIFPDIFKIAKVIPIFKSQSRVLCNNYRPISLLSNISKLTKKNQCIKDSAVF